MLEWATQVAVPLIAIVLTGAVTGGIRVSRRTPAPTPAAVPAPAPAAPPPGAVPQTPIEAWLFERLQGLVIEVDALRDDIALIRDEAAPIVRWLDKGAPHPPPTVTEALKRLLGITHHDPEAPR